MKHSSNQVSKSMHALLYITFAATLLLAAGCNKTPMSAPVVSKSEQGLNYDKPAGSISTIATGLIGPIGLEIGRDGRVWVTETGTGQNDGTVVVITSNGKKFTAINNLESIITAGGETEGPSHLLFDNGILYILGANGKMYKAKASTLIPANFPIDASTLAVEDIGAFVLAYNFVNNTHETHPYGITSGPDGDIYITDAAANAVIRRTKSGALSVLAEIPGVDNPTPIGPPLIQSVPTGIIYDGDNFLVSTLIGFPFPEGTSVIYKVSTSGAVSVYQQGFTSLVDITKGEPAGHLVLQHGIFGEMGFALNTGRLLQANGETITTLAEGLNLPSGMKQANAHTLYVTTLGDGSVLKISH